MKQTSGIPKGPHMQKRGLRLRARPAPRRGYTLVELTIVVSIVSVLAALAVFAIRKYIDASKTSEAVQMLGSIKAAQESFRAETFRYMDVSPSLQAVHPMPSFDDIGDSKWWFDAPADGPISAQARNFRTLGVTTTSPVYYGYSCVAGTSEEDPPDLHLMDTPTWPTPGGPWYVAQAFANFGGDGTHYSVFYTSSFTSDIVSAEVER